MPLFKLADLSGQAKTQGGKTRAVTDLLQLRNPDATGGNAWPRTGA
jgi:hypothetical protein